MLFVGSKGVHVEITTTWDLTNLTEVKAKIVRPDDTEIERTVPALNFDKPQSIVKLPIEEGDLTLAGVYRVQLQNETADVNRYTAIGTFAVMEAL